MSDGFRFSELPEGQRIARKGGKGDGGGSQPYKPVEYPNTLKSIAFARIAEVLSEGVIKGLATYDGVTGESFWQSVMLDGTPVWTGGGYNFNIAQVYMTAGYPDQAPVPGFAMAEAEVAVGVECTPYTAVVRRLSLPDLSFGSRHAALATTLYDGERRRY